MSARIGFLAVTGEAAPPSWVGAACSLGLFSSAGDDPGRASANGGVTGDLVLLSKAPLSGDSVMAPADLARLIGDVSGDLRSVLPPFAAALVDRRSGRTTAVVDDLGFRHLYVRQEAGWAALSTSALALASVAPTSIDAGAVAAQARIGWQIGLRTPFANVTKVPPGSVVTLEDGVVRTAALPPVERTAAPDPDAAVRSAASLLRASLSALLEEFPEAVLQLTGGQDSRILLGAVPPSQRRGLRVMTLSVPGSPDLDIAKDLAARYALDHEVVDFADLADLDPEEVHRLAVEAARRLDCAADPLAWASVAYAETRASRAVRISGLGGEVARGFYYFGSPRAVPVTRARVERLARWRIFANEGVDDGALDPAFAKMSREATIAELVRIFEQEGSGWHEATDGFYLHQRMHRWAGTLASATCLDRLVINPMLDRRFLDLVNAVPPRHKKGSLFLARLSCELDGPLSSIAMDGRPAPSVYANPTAANRLRLMALTERKIRRKVVGAVRLRAGIDHRASAGGEVVAAKLQAYYRNHAGSLDGVQRAGVFDDGFLDRVMEGEADLAPAVAALLVNLEVAAAGVASQAVPLSSR